MPSLALAETPFFRMFQATDSRYNDANGGHYDGAALLKEPGNADGSAQGAYFPTDAKLLGEAIPALSFAVGSHAVGALETGGAPHNFDLTPSLINAGFESGWPASRTDKSWRHGDYLDVAYCYVHQLYDTIVQSGGLK